MMNHPPCAAFAHEDVGRGDRHGGDDFAPGDDAEIADESRRLGGEDDFGLVGVAEDGAPGAQHRIAPNQDRAVRVDAGDLSATRPEIRHRGHVAGVEGVIEGAVGGQYGVGVGLLRSDDRSPSHSARQG